MIPDLDPDTGRLPFTGDVSTSLYTCSMEELVGRFAFNDVRRHHANRLLAWLDDLDRVEMPGDLRVSGSFLTEKPTPSDVDILVVFSKAEALQAKTALRSSWSMWTWGDITAEEPRRVVMDRLQPYGGYVDAHYTLKAPGFIERWETDWTSEYDKAADASTPTGIRMGWLEVRR